jgi:hypothetical protein
VPSRVNHTSTTARQGRLSAAVRAQNQSRGTRNRAPIPVRPPQP